MNTLLYTLLLLSITLAIHLIIWKIWLPKNHTKVLILLCAAVLVLGVIFYILIVDIGNGPVSSILQFIILYMSLSLAYITTYSALEVDSPSLVMIMNIAKQGRSGLDKNALYQMAGNDDILVIPRVKDLLKIRLAYEKSGKIWISMKGRFFLRPILIYRKMIKAEKGG